ncbi:MAG: DoxX family protein [Bacteroidota bacterium]
MLDSLSAWADDRRDLAIGLIRLYLGVGLFFRGVVFLNDVDAFFALANDTGVFSSMLAAYYVGMAHVAGGLLLAAGAFTRVAALIQLPILLAATFIVHWPDTLLLANQSFAFSALVLALLTVFAVWGGGRWSLDRAVERWTAARAASEEERRDANLEVIRARSRARLARAAERPAVAPLSKRQPCSCQGASGVRVRREYSAISRLRFVFGTHPRPARVILSCRECGGIVEVLTGVEETERYRFVRPGEV